MAWFQPQVPDDHGGHACAAGLNLKGETPGSFYPRLVAALEKQIRAVDAGR